MRDGFKGSGPRQRLRWNLLALCAVWAAAWHAPVQATDLYSEEAVKAAFVWRFAGYVDWPEDALPGRNFTIAVLGASGIATSLQALTAGRSVMNHPVQVRRIVSIQDIGDAQMLYVGSDRRKDLRSLLAPLAGRSILVVANEQDALDAGSAINLLVADHRVRFEVSLEAASAAGLRISSELLSLAVRVQK